MTRTLSLLGARCAAGSYGPGQERTPERLRAAGLTDALVATGLVVADLGDTELFLHADDPVRPDAQNLSEVIASSQMIAELLAPRFQRGDACLIVGGDCTVELGLVAAAGETNVGLIYIDLDGDLNTPASADAGRLDWMGVAHLLDLPGSQAQLSGFAGRRPLLRADQVCLTGTANLTPAERTTIAERQIAVVTAQELHTDLQAAVGRLSGWADQFDTVLLHVDVDVLDFDDFPLAENDRRKVGGLHWQQLWALLQDLTARPNVRALTMTEMNLDRSPDPQTTATELIDLLALCAESLVS